MSKVKLDDFEVLGVIGSGSFGTCYQVRCKLDKKIYVWKAIDYGKMNENKKQSEDKDLNEDFEDDSDTKGEDTVEEKYMINHLLVSEVNLLSELKHPNIVRYYDRILHKETTVLYIIMEYCEGGDLASVIAACKRNKTTVEESFVWQVLYQTGNALQACHSHLGNVTVLHRDIKPANVFLDNNGNVKLGDFGLARILKNDEAYSETIVGTPYYMSPEVLKGGKYNRKSDIWALGCLIYELCALSPPFLASSITQLACNIKNGRFNRIPALYSDDLHKMIKFMLSLDHEFRPTVEIILHHPTVVLHVSQRCISKFVPSKPRVNSNDNVVDGGLTNDLKTVSLYDREPESISENTFKRKWLARLETLRQKEAALRSREENLVNRERSLVKKEKHLLLLERLAKEKMLRAEVYLRQCKENKPVPSAANHRPNKPLEEIDTSFSADPGDTSILPTSSKLDPGMLPKPNSFMRSASERKPKHVHFMVSKPLDAKCRQYYAVKNPTNDVAQHVIDKSHQEKSFTSTVLHCHNKTIEASKQLHVNGNANTETAYTEERAVWLENKRSVYNTAAEKENIQINTTGNVRLASVATGTLRKKTHKSLSSVFSRKSLINIRH